MQALSQYDYSNLFYVALPSGTVDLTKKFETTDPQYTGVDPKYLKDLSGWAVYDHAWWPGTNDPSLPSPGEYQRFIDPLTVTSVDMVDKMVYWSRPIENWTAAEIEADTAPKRSAALGKINKDTEAFHTAFLARQGQQQTVVSTAKAFADAEYAGDVPAAVSALATETDTSVQEAADLIVSRCDDNAVMGRVFAKREKCGDAIIAALVSTELNAAMAEWNTFFYDLCLEMKLTPPIGSN